MYSLNEFDRWVWHNMWHLMRTFLRELDRMCLATIRKWLHTCKKCRIEGFLSLHYVHSWHKMITYNCTFLRSDHYQMIESGGCLDIEKKHEAKFERWFQDHIHSCGRNAENVPKWLYHFSCRHDHQVRSYRDCIVNGVRFHTKECAQTRTT